MQLPSKIGPRLLTVGEASAYTKMSKSWLNKQRLKGGFVRHVKIGARVFYDSNDLDTALEQAKRLSTSDCQNIK